MKLLSSLLLTLMGLQTYAQTIQVEYLVRVNANNKVATTESKYLLEIKNNQSVFYNLNPDLAQYIYAENPSLVQMGSKTMVSLDDRTYQQVSNYKVFKDYIANEIYSDKSIMGKSFVINDTIPNIQWNIDFQKDTVILNYPCKRATATFRGREYEAYFSAEVYPFGGPWKLDGLPGIILSARSLDGYFLISPLAATLNAKRESLTNPFITTDPKEYVTWEEVEAYTAEMMEKIARMAKSGVKVSITDGIEIMAVNEVSTLE